MLSNRKVTTGHVSNSTATSDDDSTRYMSEEVKQETNHPILPPPIGFANFVLPPPTEFANNDNFKATDTQNQKILNRSEKPPIPAKPLFLVNWNMNNNTLTESSWNNTMTGTTKLRNLMLLREPKKKPSIRQAFGIDDSSDSSLSDTDESISDEEEDETEEIPHTDATSTRAYSVSSASSLELTNEENSDQYVVAKISIPEQKISKCMHLKITESVWTAKQRIIQSLAKKLQDPLNYGLYHEKLGTFLLDHYPIASYIEGGSVGDLQMRYKYRTVENDSINLKQGKQYTKMQSASKRRDFLLYVQQCATDKMYSLIRKGIDPNFQCPNTGDTPLTVLCKSKNCTESVPVFMALLGGGAHLDFRNKKGFSPMHVAACHDNVQMIRTLLEFKASPNVLDGRDLTPLYNCVLSGSSLESARILLDHGSIVGCVDSQGWNEIHQACRHGRLHLLELLLKSDKVDSDMINGRNASGNTPLHVCALHHQEACALALLMHGTDTTIKNFANQDAVQVAHVASNINIAQQIIDFPNHKERAEFALLKAREEYVSTKASLLPPPQEARSKRGSKKHNRSTWTPGSFMKHSKQYLQSQKQQGTIGRNNTLIETYFTPSTPLENRFDSKLPPNAKMPDVKYPKSVENGTAAENKVRIVVRNYDAKNSDELTLRVGTRVIVLNARSAPAGYDDGMVDGQRGFFPKDCVEEVQLRRPHPDTGQKAINEDSNKNQRKSRSSLKKNHTSADAAFLQKKTALDSGSVVSFESGEDNHSSSAGRPSSLRSDDMSHYQATSIPGIYHHSKNVAVWKGSGGFGFILRGAKAEGQIRDFQPSPKYPGLQYLESVEEGSNAYSAGLRSGDFIIMIGETDVRRYGHQQMVETIRACGEPLNIQVTTVVRSGDTSSISSSSSSSITKKHVKGHAKNDSITSALDHLDNVIAAEESDGSERTASLRRVPGRKVGGEQLQNLFRSGVDTSSAYHRPQSTHSTFTSTKKPLRVLPPTVSITNAFQCDHIPDVDARSVRSASSSSSSSSSYTTWGRNGNPPVTPKEFRAHSVSGVTGERLLAQSGAKSRKVPPPPPKRIDSRLSMTIPEETIFKSTHVPTPSVPVTKSVPPPSSAPPPPNPQTNMAAAVALAARSRAERLSQSGEKKVEEKPALQVTPKAAEIPQNFEDTQTKPVKELSPALSIALAAKQRILKQQNPATRPFETKKHSFIINPTKSSPIIKNNVSNERHVLPPPPSNLPPPPPPSDYGDVSGLALPPPPAFPPSDPRTLPSDEIIDLPPPPMDLLPSPPSHSSQPADMKTNTPVLGVLPPPPIPPPLDDDDGCVSPSGADNLSNADSGVADVAGDGLNLSHGHRHTHDYTLGDNHSTVSSLSTNSTISSDDVNPEYSSSAGEKVWPLKEVKTHQHEDKGTPVNAAGNMYLDILKKAKNKQNNQQAASSSSPAATTKNFTVTKMTFGPMATITNSTTEVKPKTNSVFPPAPKEYANSPETKPLFGKAAPVSNTIPPKISFLPQTSAAPAVKVVETTPVVTKEKETPKISEKSSQQQPNGNKKPVGEWTVSDVAVWLNELGLAVYVDSFEENAIAGEHLPDLGKEELIELGVKPFGHRLTIERSIKKLVGST